MKASLWRRIFRALRIEVSLILWFLENRIKQGLMFGGIHFVYNALCAAAVGVKNGIEMDKILEGIANFELTKNRMVILEKNGVKIINDSYNASYDSMKAGLEILSKMSSKRRIAVLGDMLELGDFSKDLHEKVGDEVLKNKIDFLIVRRR